MHLQHGRSPVCHLRTLPLARRSGTGFRGPRRKPAVLVVGKALLYAGNTVASTDARGRRLRRGMERGREMGGQWRRRWDGQGLGEVVIGGWEWVGQRRMYEVIDVRRWLIVDFLWGGAGDLHVYILYKFLRILVCEREKE